LVIHRTPKANPTTHQNNRNDLSTVYLLESSVCLTTIRGETADTCNPVERSDVRSGEVRESMTQTTFTIAALFVGLTIAALIVLSAITLGAIAGA
jgi:hypothetical protein